MQFEPRVSEAQEGSAQTGWPSLIARTRGNSDFVRLITRRVLIAYSILVGCSAILLLVWEHSWSRAAIARHHGDLHRTFESVISEAAWTFNETVLDSVVLGLTRDGSITGAQIALVGTTKSYSSGLLSGASPGWGGSLSERYVSRWPLNWAGPRGPEIVGHLELETSDQVIKHQLLQRMLMILLSSVLALGCLFLVFVLTIRREVLSPIAKLARMMQDYRLGGRDGDTGMVPRPAGELGKLYDSFRDLEDRLRSAHGQLTSAADEMARQLAIQAEELTRAHARAVDVEVSRAQEAERRRLMRDMHDGFGSELVTARIAAERGRLTAPEVAALLSKCIADLHLIINVTGTEAGNLGEAIADWRYRLSRQLGGEPFKLVWEVNLAGAPLLSQRAVLQLLRIAQEALSNAARHSGASVIRVSAGYLGDVITLGISDNGKGFPAGGVPPDGNRGKGLASMSARAREIGAVLDLAVTSDGCTVTLAYRALPEGDAPVERKAEAIG